MIILRTLTGIRDHWPSRQPEWFMLWPAFGMGLALQAQEDMFQTSPSFAALARQLDEPAWAALCLGCTFVRLVALVVNGTFAAFRYSPHMRAVASLLLAAFWGSYAGGFAMSAATGFGAWSAPVAYSTFFAIEVVNLLRTTREVGASHART